MALSELEIKHGLLQVRFGALRGFHKRGRESREGLPGGLGGWEGRGTLGLLPGAVAGGSGDK